MSSWNALVLLHSLSPGSHSLLTEGPWAKSQLWWATRFLIRKWGLRYQYLPPGLLGVTCVENSVWYCPVSICYYSVNIWVPDVGDKELSKDSGLGLGLVEISFLFYTFLLRKKKCQHCCIGNLFMLDEGWKGPGRPGLGPLERSNLISTIYNSTHKAEKLQKAEVWLLSGILCEL